MEQLLTVLQFVASDTYHSYAANWIHRCRLYYSPCRGGCVHMIDKNFLYLISLQEECISKLVMVYLFFASLEVEHAFQYFMVQQDL